MPKNQAATPTPAHERILATTICPTCHTICYGTIPQPTLDNPTPPCHPLINPHPIPTPTAHTLHQLGHTLHQLGHTFLEETITPDQKMPRRQQAWHPTHVCGPDPTPRHPPDHKYAPGAPRKAYLYPAYMPGLTPEQATNVINTLNPPPY